MLHGLFCCVIPGIAKMLEGQAPGPDHFPAEQPVNIDPAMVSYHISGNLAFREVPEILVGKVIVIRFEDHLMALLNGREVGDVFSGIMIFGDLPGGFET
jgi:hypothetical protein